MPAGPASSNTVPGQRGAELQRADRQQHERHAAAAAGAARAATA